MSLKPLPPGVLHRNRLEGGRDGDKSVCEYLRRGKCVITGEHVPNNDQCLYGHWVNCWTFLKYEIDRAKNEDLHPPTGPL